MNPLFPDEPAKDDQHGVHYLLPRADNRIEPAGTSTNPAADLIRSKIEALYLKEPNARQEAAEVEHLRPLRSKHQEFMHRLTTSGMSLAEIQSAWHTYYNQLSDTDKREVWQEFYAANAQRRSTEPAAAQAQEQPPLAPKTHEAHPQVVISHHEPPAAPTQTTDRRSIATIKKQVLKRVRAQSKAREKAHQHLQSLAFGLGLGALVLLIFLFGLFNEMVIAPFIKPSSLVDATPIILSTDSPAPSEAPEVIIPKINVQIPIIYGGNSLAEKDIQTALNDGVFHYPTTAAPGQNGNAAYFGHSSNNIFNKGKYKFAFVRLHELEPGDIFYLTYEKKVYTYKVYTKKIVNPDETWVLGPVAGKTATAALITCDPPGTTLHRLVVWGEQISPDANGNTVAAQPSQALQKQDLPGKGPSAWSRFWSWVTPW
jgi:LPXTG-site transpeptidase (sortase) family protein